jgi:hypothetical protein
MVKPLARRGHGHCTDAGAVQSSYPYKMKVQDMKQRYRKFQRSWGTWYAFDNATGNSVSLKTREKAEAVPKVTNHWWPCRRRNTNGRQASRQRKSRGTTAETWKRLFYLAKCGMLCFSWIRMFPNFLAKYGGITR